MQELLSGILAIILLILFFIVLVFVVICECICNKKEKEYLKQLNEHDIAVIHCYLQNRKLNINDFKKKQDKKEVENED